MGTWVNVLKSHLHLVIPVSYLCHYTNLCPDLSQKRAHTNSLSHTHTHTHVWSAILVGTLHRRNGFYTAQTVFSIALHLNLHLNLHLTGNYRHFYFLKKTHSVWFISLLKYGDMGKCSHKSPSPCNTHVIIQICVLISHKCARTHTHTHTHTNCHENNVTVQKGLLNRLFEFLIVIIYYNCWIDKINCFIDINTKLSKI